MSNEIDLLRELIAHDIRREIDAVRSEMTTGLAGVSVLIDRVAALEAAHTPAEIEEIEEAVADAETPAAEAHEEAVEAIEEAGEEAGEEPATEVEEIADAIADDIEDTADAMEPDRSHWLARPLRSADV